MCYCLVADHQQVSSVSTSVPSPDGDQQHHGHHPHVSSVPQPVSLQDDDEEDQQQHCCQDDDPNLALFGRDEDTDALSEVNVGRGESMEVINKENIEKKPLDDTAVQEETQTTTVQEESQTGALRPQERVFSQSGHPTVANIVTGTCSSGVFPRILFYCQVTSMYILYSNDFIHRLVGIYYEAFNFVIWQN